MNSIASGTVLITGPTGGLGKAASLAIANRPAPQRPDLLLVGRPGQALTEVAATARAA
jgi:short-subunit dehydrogenase